MTVAPIQAARAVAAAMAMPAARRQKTMPAIRAVPDQAAAVAMPLMPLTIAAARAARAI
jgi:hypothetical protein